ncbi:MAG: glycosyltransferase family 2 protein [Bacteroidetes bacterium]|nr:glycosyltransferase family 2 protein [Bacteroidota bacterium]
MEERKKITIFTPCYNEEKNIENLYLRVRQVTNTISDYDFEHLFIDNASSDNTLSVIKTIAEKDRRVKVISNVRNFGHVRSPYYGLLQCTGEAVIAMVADLQDPPEMIPKFIKEWEKGSVLVLGIKTKSKENPFMFFIRKIFYFIIKRISNIDQLSNFTGFGLYDQKFLNVVRMIDDPYPYFRGMVIEYGWNIKTLEYTQDKREFGKSKNNFFTLYDLAMLGFVNHSKIPLRLSAFIGFFTAIISLLVAIGYLVYKLIYWDNFQVGTAPMVIGIFFFSSIQLFFIGIIGEYIGAIHTQVRKRPLVIEKERVNF